MLGLGMSPNSFGLFMTMACYSEAGAAWVDDLMLYLDGNRRVFDEGVNAIPGLRSVPLEATYLSWVDFDGTGMEREEFTRRVEQGAKIAVNHGPTFGKGGESFLRFNIATPRIRVEEAVDRLRKAFGDLQ
jgi:cystathionine beta-lyase